MLTPRTRNGPFVATLCLILAGLTVLAAGKKKQEPAAVGDRRRVLHALHRFTFGPRPGEVDRVSQQGVDQWFEQQLQPEKINDAALEVRLAPLRTLRMDTREMVENFPPPQVIKAIIDGKEPMPHDPAKRAIYEAEIARYENKQERKNHNNEDHKTEDRNNDDVRSAPAADAASAPAHASAESPSVDRAEEDEKARRREAKLYADLKAEELLAMPPDQRMREIMKMPPDEQRALLNGRSETRDQVMATLAAARVPAGALGAGGTAGAQRIQRLIDSPQPAGRGRRLAASALALIAAPAMAFSAPALALVAISHCPPRPAHSRLAASDQQLKRAIWPATTSLMPITRS